MSSVLEHELSELERIERWRFDILIDLGYPPQEAELVASRHDVDIHRLADLLAAGCSRELALEILL